MSGKPRTNNQRRKAISVSPEVYERYMARLAEARKRAGYMVSNNELMTQLLSRSVMNVDSYRLTQTR